MKKNKIFYFQDDFLKNDFAPSCGAEEIKFSYLRKNYNNFQDCVFFARGIGNLKYCNFLKENNINFFYVDTGYFGNLNFYYKEQVERPKNLAKKLFHRIVFNEMQNSVFVNRSNQRYNEILKKINDDFGASESAFLKPWNKNGKNILLCPPSKKISDLYKFNLEDWINRITKKIRKFSDREIIIRRKPLSRKVRTHYDTIQSALDQDIFILVTFNSISAVDAIIHGIPTLTLGKNAASNLSIQNIEDIENPIYPERKKWLHNLSYHQFHLDEIKNGIAWNYLEKEICQG